MKTINLPADVEHLYLDEVAHLIADALVPHIDDQSDARYEDTKVRVLEELNQAAKDGTLKIRHPLSLGLLTLGKPPQNPIDAFFETPSINPSQCVVLPVDMAVYVADRGFSVIVEASEQATQPQTAPAQNIPTPAPVVQATETREQRQDRRLKACIDAGLPMDTRAALSRLPDGVGNVADREGVTRQAFSTDVKAALTRRKSAIREGVQVHRV